MSEAKGVLVCITGDGWVCMPDITERKPNGIAHTHDQLRALCERVLIGWIEYQIQNLQPNIVDFLSSDEFKKIVGEL